MAYENYYFVSWANGTPITGDRLNQMSINIEQVKDATSSSPKGILAYNFESSQIPNTTGWNTFLEYELTHLRNEQVFDANVAIDNSVSIDSNRYYRLSFDLPAINITGAGAEDSHFTIALYQGTDLANTGTSVLLKRWNITPHTYSYINVAAANANIANEALKSNTAFSRIGAGTYTAVFTSTAAVTGQSFYLTIKRNQGASANRAPNYYVDANSSSLLQFWAEDLGGR